MGAIKSVQKRIRQAEKLRMRNKHYSSMMKTHIKKVLGSENKETAQSALRKAVSVIDKVSAKGIIHKNKAANQKSRLYKYVSTL